MRRIGDVFDVWFDSGSMPYAQVHHPFENAEWFEHHYPGDFIVEYIGQTRGWFYTMHVLATALFDRPAFSSCISHGIVLGSDGAKMSKSLRNYPDVSEVFDRDGADAMRWFLMSSPILRGGNLVVTEQGIREGVRQTLIPLWNAYYFFTLYANAANGGAGYEAKESRDSEHVLDRYVLGKLDELVATLTTRLDALDVAGACDAVRGFLEVLSNWYIRRSRDRFWDGGSPESYAAFDTLYTVLETTTRAAAPLLPLVAEEVWRGLTGGRSVHLTDWPEVAEPAKDAVGLTAAMDRVREVCSTGSALRKAEGLRVRLPLTRLTVVADDAAALAPYVDLVRDELNVRVGRPGRGERRGRGLLRRAPGAAGQRACRRPAAGARRAAGDQGGQERRLVGRRRRRGDVRRVRAGRGRVHARDAGRARRGADEHRAVSMLPGGGFVVLDTEVTPELAAEGLARDVVRAVQQARRDAGLDVSDRIALVLGGDDGVRRRSSSTATSWRARCWRLGRDRRPRPRVAGRGRRRSAGALRSAGPDARREVERSTAGGPGREAIACSIFPTR